MSGDYAAERPGMHTWQYRPGFRDEHVDGPVDEMDVVQTGANAARDLEDVDIDEPYPIAPYAEAAGGIFEEGIPDWMPMGGEGGPPDDGEGGGGGGGHDEGGEGLPEGDHDGRFEWTTGIKQAAVALAMLKAVTNPRTWDLLVRLVTGERSSPARDDPGSEKASRPMTSRPTGSSLYRPFAHVWGTPRAAQ